MIRCTGRGDERGARSVLQSITGIKFQSVLSLSGFGFYYSTRDPASLIISDGEGTYLKGLTGPTLEMRMRLRDAPSRDLSMSSSDPGGDLGIFPRYLAAICEVVICVILSVARESRHMRLRA